MTEEFDLHLFELTTSKNVVSWVNFVAKRFSDLGDSEGKLEPCAVEHVSEVHEDSLCRFGPQVSLILLVTQSADICLEHQIELSRLGQLAFVELARRFARLEGASHTGKLIAPETALAPLGLAIDHWILEPRDVSARLPHLRVHDDGAIDADHGDFLAVGSGGRVADHVVPPGVLDVLLQLDAERSVVPEPVDAAVDFARLKDEPAPPAEGD